MCWFHEYHLLTRDSNCIICVTHTTQMVRIRVQQRFHFLRFRHSSRMGESERVSASKKGECPILQRYGAGQEWHSGKPTQDCSA